MSRLMVVGGPHAGRIEHVYGPNHGLRWRIAEMPAVPASLHPEAASAEVTINYAEYEIQQFNIGKYGSGPLYVLAPVGWDGLDIMGELLAAYQRVKAQAGEAGTAETAKTGSVHEHAVPEGDAPNV